MKEIIDLGWGCPTIVRQALVETLGRNYGLDDMSLSDMGYPPHFGNSKLISRLRDLAKRQSGHEPKHLFVTMGATGAINAALHALRTQLTDWVVTNKRYYPLYNNIVHGMTSMIRIDRSRKKELLVSGLSEKNFISLTDSPSNPEGLVNPFESVDIWDSAYASKTYSSGGHVPAKWKIMAGSLSKTLGLAGLRLGWASTDDDNIADSLGSYVTASYIGLSSLSMGVAEKVLDMLDFEKFETKSAKYIDDNREQMQKVVSKFGQGEISSRGMFAILQLGKSERKALEKANVKWLPGSIWGETDDWARISLGPSRETIKNAVKAILK